jgi:hypothetical protein
MRIRLRVMMLAGALCVAGLTQTMAQGGLGLVQTVVKQVGVTEQQAQGGTGLLLNYAKGQLPASDFQKVTTAMPEVTGLATTGAELQKKSGGALGGLGGGLGAAAGLASLAGPFKQLGMSPDMVGKMAPVVLDYAKTTGGAEVGSLLTKVLAK